MAINVKNAKWNLSKEEKVAIKWFEDNGFEGGLDKQYLSKTKFTVRKNGVEDKFELPQGTNGLNAKKYMEEYGKSFDLLCELQSLRAMKNSIK